MSKIKITVSNDDDNLKLNYEGDGIFTLIRDGREEEKITLMEERLLELKYMIVEILEMLNKRDY